MSSRFGEVFRFELKLHAKRWSTWVYLAVLFALGLLFVMIVEDNTTINLNSPVAIAQVVLFTGFAGVLVTAALFGDAGARDRETRMQPLFFTTPLRRLDYLGGRFLGAFVVNALLMIAPLAGYAISVSFEDPARLGPFSLMSYVQPYALFTLTALLMNGAALFAMSALSKRSFPVYLGAFLIFLAYTIGIAGSELLSKQSVASVLDPSGILAVGGVLRDWTPAQQNVRLIPLEGVLLWNRLMWTGIAVSLLGYTYLRFRFSVAGGELRKGRSAELVDEEGIVRAANVAVPGAPRFFGTAAHLKQVATIARRSLREVVVSRDFAVILIGLLVLIVIGLDSNSDRYGTPLLPTTGLLATSFGTPFVKILVVFVIAFYAGELVWRERDTGVSDISDAMPLPDWVPFAGKLLGLGILLVFMQVVFMIAGMIIQALMGHNGIEPLLYLRILFGIHLPDYLMFATLAMFVHVLANNKYVGNFAIVVLAGAMIVPPMFGPGNNMLLFASVPHPGWSDMIGFGLFAESMTWYRLYWLAWTLVLGLAGVVLWVRGRETGVRRRATLAHRRLAGRIAVATGFASAAALALGGFVFYNTAVLNDYWAADAQEMRRASYERLYKSHEAAAQPEITRTRLDVQIQPERARVELRGSYKLVNRSGVTIDTIRVSTPPSMETRELTLSRAARQIVTDDDTGFHTYSLSRGLAPGDSIDLAFDVVSERRGFANAPPNPSIVPNGTFLDDRFLPAIGYQAARELASEETREKHKLAERQKSKGSSPVPATASNSAPAHQPDFEVVISTSLDQTAVAPGKLEREWTENGRRYFKYTSRGSPSSAFAVLSGRLALREKSENGVAAQVYHHPGHTKNVDHIARTLQTAMAYFSRNFGAYPHDAIRVVEAPRTVSGSLAYTGLLIQPEASSFLSRISENGPGTDTPLLITAEETARQWWGNGVLKSGAEESEMLFDILAQYSAMIVMEKIRGRERTHDHLRQMLIEYLNRRERGDAPLLDLGSTPVTHSRKGPVVMYALRHHLGEARINAALRKLVERHQAGELPNPSMRDLYGELESATPEALRPILHDYVRDITVWDLRVWSVKADSLANGDYRVAIEVEGSKAKIDTAKRETPVPMSDSVEIEVRGFSRDRSDSWAELYLKKHLIRTGRQTIVVTVPGKPMRGAIDPHHLLIDRRGDDLSNNFRPVDEK